MIGKKILLPLTWFPIASILLFSNIFLLYSLSSSRTGVADNSLFLSPLADRAVSSINASYQTSQVLGAKIVAADARTKLLEEFLKQHDSPLIPYASKIVEEADKNGIDFRLVVSIAMCESNLGKRMPPNSYNAWGIAIYTGMQSGKVFNNWEHAIEWVSRYLKERYIDRGIYTLREIGAIYAPPSVEKGHSWSKCVETFQQSIY